MSTKRINVTTILPPSAPFIGYVAENGVTNVEFDVSAWVTMYGSGTATLIVKRWGDANPYPIALEVDNEGLATWTISATDTAKKGFACAQLRYEAGTKVKKSPIYTLKIGESLGSPAEAPDQYEDWIDALTHIAAQAMAEVLDIEGIVTDKTLTVDGGIADAKATGDALALKADKSTTYTKTEVDQMIEDVEVETDTTLTISGAPADAKKTGDELSALKADLGAQETSIGNLSELKTTEKTSLVAAINEAAKSGGSTVDLSIENYIFNHAYTDKDFGYSIMGASNNTVRLNRQLDFTGKIKHIRLVGNPVVQNGNPKNTEVYILDKDYNVTKSITLTHNLSGIDTTVWNYYDFDVDIEIEDIDMYIAFNRFKFVTLDPGHNSFPPVSNVACYTQGTVTSTKWTDGSTKSKVPLMVGLICDGELRQKHKNYAVDKTWNFSESDDEWSLTSATVSNGLSVSSGGIAYWNKYITFEKFEESAVITVGSANAIFGLINYDTLKGACFLVDLSNGLISICKAYIGGSTIPDALISASIPSVSVGERLYMNVSANAGKYTFDVYVLSTGQRVTVEYDNYPKDPELYCGYAWGGCGIKSFSGAVACSEMTYHADVANNLIIGNSITQGYNIQSTPDKRWADIVRSEIFDGDALIYGRGGGGYYDLLQRLSILCDFDLMFDTIIIAIGTNDLQSGTSSMLAKAKSLYAYAKFFADNVVICSVPFTLNSSAQTAVDYRTALLTVFDNVINFVNPTSTDYAGSSADTNKFSDYLHPNVAGHKAMADSAILFLRFTGETKPKVVN